MRLLLAAAIWIPSFLLSEPSPAAEPLFFAESASRASLHAIDFPSPPAAWHLGMPVADGELGAMVWGDGGPLILTLDRYDVWESRSWKPDPLRYNYERWRKLIEEKCFSEIKEEFETKHWAERDRGEVPSPTRLPLGRLEITLPGGRRLSGGKIDLVRAEARLALPPAGEVRVLAHATSPVIAVEIAGPDLEGLSWGLIPARLGEGETRRLERLGYKAPSLERNDAEGWQEMRWVYSGDREVVTFARASRLDGERLLILVSIRTAPVERRKRAAADAKVAPLTSAQDLARKEAAAFLEAGGWTKRVEEHRSWWSSFWGASSIEIPDEKLEALWYRELYKLGSLSRPGKFPVSLQGLWSKDGGLPPWAGDYHLDMNVQETYWPVYASNHLELGLPLYEQFFKNLPRYRRMCREFFGFDGLYTRCEQALDGSEIFGYYTTNFWAGNGAWLAHHFWLHWRYSLDFEFLAQRAFPFLRSAMDLYLGLLEKGEDGYYHLRVTNSPEFHENGDAAWGEDDAGNLSLIRFLCEALIEADRILVKNDPQREQWEDILANLAPLPGTLRDPATGGVSYRPGGRGILVMKGRPYDMPHRHMTHVLGIYPLCIFRKGMSEDVDRLIDDSIENILKQNSPIGDWTGWTFPWVSLLGSHSGRPALAVEMLHKYVDAHTYPNTLHENGDWRGLGTTRIRYGEPTVTLEAGFAAAAAVTDLLLQSDGGAIRLFPAAPEDWRRASFKGLRAEGAFVVSARLENGALAEATLLSEKGGTCRLAGLRGKPDVKDQAGAAAAVDFEAGKASFPTSPGLTYRLRWEKEP